MSFWLTVILTVSHVVPLWVRYGFLDRDDKTLPKQELHQSLQVDCRSGFCSRGHIGTCYASTELKALHWQLPNKSWMGHKGLI